jgi:hypothetical protein
MPISHGFRGALSVSRIYRFSKKILDRNNFGDNPLFGPHDSRFMTLAKAMLCPALFVSWCSAALGDILLEGAIYCDTPNVLSEMTDVARAGDDKELARLVATGHVAPKTLSDNRVKVFARGDEPDSPVQFAFNVSPIPYWTLSRWVAPEQKEAASSPHSLLSSSPASDSIKATKKIPGRGAIPPFDDRGGQIVWHQVNGKWKWRPRDPAHFKGVPPSLPGN